MDAALVFLFDYATEICAVFWVLSVNRRNKSRAIFYTCLSAILTRGALYFIIDNRDLLAVSALGEVLGTVTAMILDERRKDVKRIQKRARSWITHSVLRRSVSKRVRPNRANADTTTNAKAKARADSDSITNSHGDSGA